MSMNPNDVAADRENDRRPNGQFGRKSYSEPDSTLAETAPSIAPDKGLVIGWHHGQALTLAQAAERGIGLDDLDSVQAEEFIEVVEGGTDAYQIEQLLRENSDVNISNVYLFREDEDSVTAAVAVYENFLWDADVHFPDSDSEVSQERASAWLDEHSDVVEAVYKEWFDAELSTDDGWASAQTTLHVRIPNDRLTESLAFDDISDAMAKWVNETDPGTYGSPYVMDEVRRRVDANG